MGLFKRKEIQHRVKPRWQRKTCSFETLCHVLHTEEGIELWVQWGERFFQLGTSGEFAQGRGFFNKVYYLNFRTDESLYYLLNDKIGGHPMFRMEADLERLLATPLPVGGCTLRDMWHEAVVVGVDEMDPDNYLGL